MRPTYTTVSALCKGKNFFYPHHRFPPQLRRIIKVSSSSTKFSKRTFLPHFRYHQKKTSSSVRLLVPHKFCKNGGKEEKWGPFPSPSRQVGRGKQKKKTRAAASCFFFPSYTIFFLLRYLPFSRIEKKTSAAFSIDIYGEIKVAKTAEVKTKGPPLSISREILFLRVTSHF